MNGGTDSASSNAASGTTHTNPTYLKPSAPTTPPSTNMPISPAALRMRVRSWRTAGAGEAGACADFLFQ